jgi:tetratricopeptide (TPR) repeat protein
VAPNSPWRHQASGEALESQHDYDAALAAYRQVLALAPAKPGVHFRIGRVLLAKSPDAESRAQAAKEFEKELEIDSSNANAAYELGEVRRKAGELEPARELFELALKHYPEFEEAQIALGRTLLDLGKADLALPHFQKAVALDPNDAVGYFQMARAYGALGKTSEQERAAEQYRRLRERELRDQEARSTAPSSPRDVTRQEVDPQTAK